MKKTVQDILMHDHTCLIFKNQTEFFHCAIPFLRDGINKNEKCLLVLDDITREDAIRYFKYIFKDEIFNLQKVLSYITIESFKNLYFPDNKFNLERNLKMYLTAVKKAVTEEGFTGVRVFAEVSSTLQNRINLEEFYLYEAEVDKCFKNNKFLAVCAYNKKLFSDEYVSQIINVHPVEIDVINTRL